MFQLLTTIVAILLLLADQLSKKWVVSTFIDGEITLNGDFVSYTLSEIHEIPLIDNALYFKFAPNTGVAFSLFSNNRWILVGLTSVLIIACLSFYLSGKIKNKLEMFSLAIIISGGIGNLIDRVKLGYVIDFIDFRLINFAIFNVADMCITVGAFLLLLAVFFEEKKESKKSSLNTSEENVLSQDSPDATDSNLEPDFNEDIVNE